MAAATGPRFRRQVKRCQFARLSQSHRRYPGIVDPQSAQPGAIVYTFNISIMCLSASSVLFKTLFHALVNVTTNLFDVSVYSSATMRSLETCIS